MTTNNRKPAGNIKPIRRKNMLILTREDMEKVFTMKDAVEADKEALKLYTEGRSEVPLRSSVSIQEENGTSLFMPAFVGGVNASGIKIVSVYPDNIEKGLTSVPASMVLLDSKTGFVNCIMDGTYLTQLRTGAVSGAATDLLARKDSKIMALIGTGGQAVSQALAAAEVRPIEEIRVFDLSPERTENFVKELKGQLPGILIKAASSSDEAVDGADIITTVTTSPRPTFDPSKVKPGAHINGVGSYTPDKRELPEEIIKKAGKVYVDTKNGVMNEAGDFIIPISNKVFTEDIITGEIGELILGRTKGRENDEEITLFKTVGSAVLDVVTADMIYKRAVKAGEGKEVTI